MNRLYLHVGWEKCGSSALQRALCSAPSWRTRFGECAYAAFERTGAPLTGSDLSLRAAKTSEGYISTAKSFPRRSTEIAQLDELLKSRSIVLSREAWCRQAPRFLQNNLLAKLNAPITVVVYIRPQVDLLNSSWWQWWCYRRRYKSPLDWLERNGYEHFDYHRHLCDWKRVPGVEQLSIRLLPKDIATDFFPLTECLLTAQATKHKIARDNATLPLPVIRSVRRLIERGAIKYESTSSLTFRLKDLWGEHDMKPWAVTKETAARLLESLRESNEKLLTLLDEGSAKAMQKDPRWWTPEAYDDHFSRISPLARIASTEQDLFQSCLDQAILYIATMDRASKTRSPSSGSKETMANPNSADILSWLGKRSTSLASCVPQRGWKTVFNGESLAPDIPQRFQRFWQSQRYTICRSPELFCTGGNFMPFTKELDVLSDCTLPLNWRPSLLRTAKRYLTDTSEATPFGTGILVLGSHKNYFHWMVNWLSRASRVDNAGLLPEVTALMIGSNAPSFVRNSIAACSGLSHLPITELKDECCAYIRDGLICPIIPYPQYCSNHLDWLRKKFLPQSLPENTPRKIFISRQSASSRRLENHKEVAEIVAGFGFVEIDPSTCTVEEQACIFGQATHIVAVHGSALTNLLFCKRGVSVVEFQSDARFSNLYPALGHWVGANYRLIRGPASGAGTLNHQDIRIQPEELLKVLQQAVARPRRRARRAGSTDNQGCLETAPAPNTQEQVACPSVTKKAPAPENNILPLSTMKSQRLKAYSQFGEDIFLVTQGLINKSCPSGVVVEVGAFDGVKYSNSKLFEESFGFRCILIEPSSSFRRIPINRPQSAWYQCAAATSFGIETFAGGSVVAGMTKHMPESYRARWKVEAMQEYKVLTMPLDAIVKIEKLQFIDFLSIDVQGAELEVLGGFSFSIPLGIVCIEMEDHDLRKNQLCRELLTKAGLTLFASVQVSEFWINEDYFRSSAISDKSARIFTIDSFEPLHIKPRFLRSLRQIGRVEQACGDRD